MVGGPRQRERAAAEVEIDGRRIAGDRAGYDQIQTARAVELQSSGGRRAVAGEEDGWQCASDFTKVTRRDRCNQRMNSWSQHWADVVYLDERACGKRHRAVGLNERSARSIRHERERAKTSIVRAVEHRVHRAIRQRVAAQDKDRV